MRSAWAGLPGGRDVVAAIDAAQVDPRMGRAVQRLDMDTTGVPLMDQLVRVDHDSGKKSHACTLTRVAV
jgi:hypothetical protein